MKSKSLRSIKERKREKLNSENYKQLVFKQKMIYKSINNE